MVFKQHTFIYSLTSLQSEVSNELSKAKIKGSAEQNPLEALGRMCPLPLQASGGCWHCLTWGLSLQSLFYDHIASSSSAVRTPFASLLQGHFRYTECPPGFSKIMSHLKSPLPICKKSLLPHKVISINSGG